jgi:hypothetical protein
MTQCEYIALLFDDCGFNAAQRKDYLKSRYYGCEFPDELSSVERSAVVEDLKERKAAMREREVKRWGHTLDE